MMNAQKLSRRKILQLLTVSMAGSSMTSLNAFGKDIYEKDKPIYIPSGSGKKGKIGEGSINFKFDKGQTNGHLGLSESILPAGLIGAPPHYHQNFDEICRVTQGVLTIMVGTEIFEVKQGDWHLRPKGIVHSFWNSGSQTAKFIEIYTPGGHERYMSELTHLFESSNRPKPGDLDALAHRHDIVFDWTKLEGIIKKYNVHL